MDDTFKEEAKQVINNFMKGEFTTHEFLQIYTMGYTISYLSWLRKYQDVGKLHRTIGSFFTDHQKELGIQYVGKVDESMNLHNRLNEVAIWKKIKED